MQIISLEIENIKKIKAAKIEPKDNVVMVQGDNGAGKSSVLDSIVMALKGGKAIPEKPIREGADKGGIKMEFDDFTVIRTFTQKGSYLKIETKAGAMVKSPQEFLDKLVGKISFDPLEFINQDEKKQRKVLMELIGVDVDALDKREKEVFDERAIKGRELKQQEGKYKALGTVDRSVPDEEVKLSDLVSGLEAANRHNQEIEDKKNALKSIKESALRYEEFIREYEAKIEEYKNNIQEKKAEFKKIKAEVDGMEVEDVDQIRTMISEAEGINEKVRQNKVIKHETEALNRIKEQHEELEQKLKIVRDDRVKLLAEAPIPVEGLTFEGDGLTYNGIPLNQCSDGEKLMISMGISMALNPTMRVLRIKDGSLLGKKNRELLSELVKGKGFQLWLEAVSDRDQYNASGKVGILIEDGGIVAVDGVEQESKKEESKQKKEQKAEKVKDKVNNKVEEDDEW